MGVNKEVTWSRSFSERNLSAMSSNVAGREQERGREAWLKWGRCWEVRLRGPGLEQREKDSTRDSAGAQAGHRLDLG